MSTVQLATRGTVHIAGPDVRVNAQLRQRCSWCGALLLDYDLERTASPCGADCQANGCKPEHHLPATWPAGGLVEVAANTSWRVPLEEGKPLPPKACAQLDDTVTV